MPPSFRKPKPTPASPKHFSSSLVAAAQRVVHPQGGLAKHTEDHRVAAWQREAWQYYDLIGELRYGARYYGNSLSQMRLYVGWKPDTGTRAEKIDLDDPPEGFDRRQYDIALETLNRVHSLDGSIAEILRQFGTNLFVAGEGYLVGRTDPDTGMERWDFYSTEQLVYQGGTWMLQESAMKSVEGAVPLGDGDYVIRVWNPHPRYSDEPDSPLRSILSICEDLLMLTASVRAAALSRIPSGVLLMPDTMLDAGPDIGVTNAAGDPIGINNDAAREEQAQGTLEEIYRHFITPIADPESAAAVAPFILTGDPEDLEQVRLIEFDREIDHIAAEQRKEIIRRMAHGIDLPTEVLQGMTSVNHWTAWQIEESSYKAHIRPAISMFCASVTSSLIWPAIKVATGADPDRRLVIGFDPIDLISHIDRRMNAKDGHAALVISDQTYRRALGFTDDDAPNDDEYVRRMAVAQGSVTLSPVASGERQEVVQALDEAAERERIARDPKPVGRPPSDEPEPEPDAPDAVDVGPPPAEPVTASAVVSPLGRKLVDIDRGLMERLDVLATAAMRRSLERAGARIRSKISRDTDMKRQVADVSNYEVASVLGESRVRGLFETDEAILQEDFSELGVQYDQLTKRAQRQVRRLVAEYGLPDGELDALERQQDVERREGWLLLSGLLAATAFALLYKPKITARDINGVEAGEFDDMSVVPFSHIRAALAVAGGNAGISTAGGAIIGLGDTPLGLLATGETAQTYLSAAGVEPVGFRWVYGDELRQTFEPHLDLDGEEFTGWQDDRLVNGEPFPATPFFYPGDHNGCRCLVEYLYPGE